MLTATPDCSNRYVVLVGVIVVPVNVIAGTDSGDGPKRRSGMPSILIMLQSACVAPVQWRGQSAVGLSEHDQMLK